MKYILLSLPYDISTTTTANMPSNAKLARIADQKKSSVSKVIEHYVEKFVMPPAYSHAHKNFNATDATYLLAEFKTKAIKYFGDGNNRGTAFELGATDTGMYMKNETDILISVSVENPKPIILHCDKQKTLLEELVADRQKSRNETFCYYHRIAKQLMWGNNEEMKDQMKAWKKQHADGDLTIYDDNNHEFVISGKTYYTLTITAVSDGEAQQCGFDPLGVGVHHFVDGYMYWFVHKENRDAVVKYVMELD